MFHRFSFVAREGSYQLDPYWALHPESCGPVPPPGVRITTSLLLVAAFPPPPDVMSIDCTIIFLPRAPPDVHCSSKHLQQVPDAMAAKPYARSSPVGTGTYRSHRYPVPPLSQPDLALRPDLELSGLLLMSQTAAAPLYITGFF